MKTYNQPSSVKRILYLWLGISAVVFYEQIYVYWALHRFHIISVLAFYAIDIPYFFAAAKIMIPFSIMRPPRILRICVAAVTAICCFVLLQNIVDALLDYKASGQFNFTISWQKPFWRWVYLSLISAFYYIAVYGKRQARYARALEIEKLELQAAVLRARIKPHFVFHALQFLQAEIQPLSGSAGRAVELFSEVTHYNLESDSGNTLLREELEQVQNYIELNSAMRRGSIHLIYNTDQDTNTTGHPFPPMVLLNLVENMFDHGILSDEKKPGLISIDCRNNQLLFYSLNLRGKARKAGGTGIGTAYVRSQLESRYSGRYTLRIKEEGQYYEVNLRVEL